MIDITNESGSPADEEGLVGLATFALDRLRIHPSSELSIILVDEGTMEAYHEKFMGLPGPTDVLSFPMDEMRAPGDDEDPPSGLLGDIVLCPTVTARQAAENGRTPDGEAEYLLGHDHAEPEEKRVMFGLNDEIIAAWDDHREQAGQR